MCPKIKLALPRIHLAAKPAGLTFRAPQSALAKWNRSIRSAKKDDSLCEIAILSEIGPEDWGGFSAGMMKEALDAAAGAPVRLLLNSPGGDAFEGIAIYNLLRDHAGMVTVRVLGMAASAASVVAMAGDRIEMGEAATLMIHSAWGVVVGNRADMLQFAEVLDTLDSSVAELYARRSGQPLDEVRGMMEQETWMSAQDAVDLGFADVSMPADPPEKPKHAAYRGSLPALARSAALAASGDTRCPIVRMSANPPGASGYPKGNTMKTIAEQISAFEAKRAANLARMGEIMSKAGDEGRTLDETETTEYDGLNAEVKTVEAHLVRLHAHEKVMISTAARLTPAAGADPDDGAAIRGAQHADSGIISIKSNLPQGIPFVRYVRALAMAKGNLPGALAIAQNNQRWKDETPEVAQVLMAAVAAGDTTTAGWASELVYNQNLVAAFLEYLRPQTIIGKISSFTRVPFNVRWGSQTSGSTGYWVGQGKPVPVSKLATGSGSLGIAKAAGLVVLDQELVRSSEPSAELLVRQDLAKAIAQFLDVNFIAPDYAAVANVNPASITNGVTPTAPTGTTADYFRADAQTLLNAWISQNLDPSGGVWIMTPGQALAISLMLNSLGQPLYPKMGINGGELFGLPVVVSNSAQQVGSPVAGEGQMLVLLHAPSIAMADDGQVTIDASAEASIEMLDNPTNDSVVPTATTSVSMFQTNSVALRATRFINWAKRRTFAVSYVKDAAYK